MAAVAKDISCGGNDKDNGASCECSSVSGIDRSSDGGNGRRRGGYSNGGSNDGSKNGCSGGRDGGSGGGGGRKPRRRQQHKQL